MVNFPAENDFIEKKQQLHNTYLCFGYDEDLYQIYDFYCARYRDMSYKEFLDLGINELQIKLMSIPEDEPLFNIIRSRTINTSKIKDKEERKYWQELKKLNKIPDVYLPKDELDRELNKKLGGIKNGKRFM